MSTASTATNVIIVIQKVQTNSESIAPPCAERTGGSHHRPQPSRRSAAEAVDAAKIDSTDIAAIASTAGDDEAAAASVRSVRIGRSARRRAVDWRKRVTDISF